MEELKDLIARIDAIEDPMARIRELNKHLKESDDLRDKGLPRNISEVERFDNIAYGVVPKWQELDVYLPKERLGKVATIIHIHGGGWTYGTKETYQFFGLEFAKAGFGFVNFNYRLPPDVIFPGELDDVNLAMHWVAEHGAKYDIDTDNIVIMGDSAGGQMALQYVTLLTNKEYRAKFGYEKPNFTVRATVVNCAASFLTRPEVLSPPTKVYFTEEVLTQRSIMLETENYMTTDIGPLLLTTANADMLLEANARLDGYLLAKGINHEFKCYGDMGNPRHHVFNYNIRDSIAKQCNQDIAAFIQKHINQVVNL